MVIGISKERYGIYSFSKLPAADIYGEEKEWYADPLENILGAIILDKYEQDWLYVVLGRDEDGKFKCIDIQINFDTIGKARNKLIGKIEEYSTGGQSTFPQGGWDGKKNEIFKLLVPEEKLDPFFKTLSFSEGYSPAKEVIKEIAFCLEDVDGNFVQQFQTAGFNPRLWELYLYAVFHEQRFKISREFRAPDYLITKFGIKLCIEATTVNPTEGIPVKGPSEIIGFPPPEEMEEKLKDFIPIKFGSSLYSKLTQKYWTKPHVSGNPFIIAIADFHEKNSMVWSTPGLIRYLYGYEYVEKRDMEGNLILKPQRIEKHVYEKKEIPSGFFYLPEAENISGVLFSNSATLSKFNRIGKIAGFGSPRIEMVRKGLQYNFDRNSIIPTPFSTKVEPGEYSETWSEGLSIFHNPVAKYPIPEYLFSGIGNHFLTAEKQIKSRLPEFFPISSMTYIIGTYIK